MKNVYVMATYVIVLAFLISLVGTASDLVSEAVFMGESREPFWKGFGRMLMVQSTMVTIAYFVVLTLNQRLSWARNTLLRVATEIGAVLVIAALMVTLARLMASTRFENVTEEDLGRFLMLISMSSFMMGLLAFAFVEVWFRIRENRQLELNVAHLEQKITLSQYQALRAQLNPHFLFNSLNTLASLIYVDVNKADEFIQEFAEVYRYVLRLTNEPTVSVREEMDFLHSYLFLLRIRFNDNLIVHESIDPALLNGQIPPLTLQLLIENAIKHNEVSEERPLHIHLESEGGQLLVRNNVQLRQDVTTSNGYGWQNLRDRYHLMGARLPRYHLSATEFVAEVPIILERNEIQRADRRG